MNWDEVGAIGQVLGSIAVFITLGYLAVQLRHSISQGQRALSQGRTDALLHLYAQGSSERISPLMAKANVALGQQPSSFMLALMAQAALTREEAVTLTQYQASWWNHRLQMIASLNELSALERTAFDAGLRGQYGQPGVFRLFYDEVAKRAAHPDAVRYIDNLLAQPA